MKTLDKVKGKLIAPFMVALLSIGCSKEENITHHLNVIHETMNNAITHAVEYPTYRNEEDQVAFDNLVSSAQSFSSCLKTAISTRPEEELNIEIQAIMVDMSNYIVLLTQHIGISDFLKMKVIDRDNNVSFLKQATLKDKKEKGYLDGFDIVYPTNNKICQFNNI